MRNFKLVYGPDFTKFAEVQIFEISSGSLAEWFMLGADLLVTGF